MFLASKSPQRKALLESLGIDFDIVVPDYHELDPPGAPPEELVELHSCGKALSVLPSLIPLSAGRPVLGVDTMVVIGGEAVGKAADEEEARSFLRLMSGSTHEVMSGIAIVWAESSGAVIQNRKNSPVGYGVPGARPLTTAESSGQDDLWLRKSHSVTSVKFSRISDAELDAYLATGEWRGRAGAYAIQERASAFAQEIHGDYTNVVGLPVPLLVNMMSGLGLWPPQSWISGRSQGS